MPSQKCFSVKIRTGARTPFEASVTMLSVNDELMSLNGSEVRTSQIGERILSAINKEFEKPLKAAEPAAQSGEAPVQQPKPKIISLCIGCVKENCSQRSEIECCPVTLCAMRQAK